MTHTTLNNLFSLSHFQAGESSGLFKKTISKLSTEYRIQFIWPYSRINNTKGTDDVDFPRKSISMGVIRTSSAMPTVHQKRTVADKEGATLRRF